MNGKEYRFSCPFGGVENCFVMKAVRRFGIISEEVHFEDKHPKKTDKPSPKLTSGFSENGGDTRGGKRSASTENR